MLHGLIAAALLLARAEDLAPAPPPPARTPAVASLAAEVRAAPESVIAGLVANDPRFAALGPAEREALLRAVAIEPGWHAAASAANVLVGFGVGSIVEGDRRGLVLTATDTVAFVALLVAATSVAAEAGTESGPTTAAQVAPVAAGLLIAGRVVGLILPWTWDGRRHAAVARGLASVPPPPPRSALLVAPLVVSSTGRAAPGATLVLRF